MTTERELEFLGTLGKGGFGSVYLANLHGRDQFVRRVAVKILRHAGDSDASLVARQRDEARLLGLLSHEGIVQVLDLTEIEGRPAVIMEYIEGADVGELARLLRARSTPFSPRAAFEIVAMAAGALDVAWSSPSPISGRPLNVIHRDIKPANIVVTLRGGVKVLDFGIARAEFNREGVTQSGFFGTPAYMAPEFWVQEPIGSAYDIFALGVTLLELVTGVVPERAPMEPGRLASFMEARIAPVGLPPAAAALLRGMLAFAGPERPTAGEVAERAAELAPGLPGESLPRLARALVPGVIEVRSRSLDTKDLPSRTSLGIVSGPATGPAAGDARATARGVRPDPAPTLLRGPRGPLLIGGAVVGGAAVMLTSALALFAWLGWPGIPSPEGVSNVDPDMIPASPEQIPVAPVAPVAVADPPAPTDALAAAADAPAASAGVPATALPPTTSPVRASHGGSTPRGDAGVVRISASPGSSASPTAAPTSTPSTAVVVAPPTGPSAAPSAPPEQAEREPAASAPVKRSLSLGCTVVGAALQLDGVSAGTTPRASVLVADGSHVLIASLGDRSCRRTVTVGPDQPVGYICDLTTQTWSAKL